VVRLTDGSICSTEVASKLSGDLVGKGGFCSLLDWGLAKARLEGGLGKRLMLSTSDLPVVLRILLQQVEKETSGDSNYIVSDLIQLERKVARVRGEGSWPDQEVEEGDKVGKAAALYKAYLKKNGLVDCWEVMSLVGDLAKVVLWGVHADEAPLLEKIVGKQVSLANVELGEVALTPLADGKLKEVKLERGAEDLQSLAGAAAFLRILVNPKDNLAVARAFTSSSLLTAAQFTEVRREAERQRMPCLPACVSFVRKVGLGGKSYQPEEDNALHQFLPQLVEFNRILEKLQTKLEEVAGAEEAVQAVLSSLNLWLEKQGEGLGPALQERLDGVLKEAVVRMAKVEATPAKTGRLGRPAMKLATCVADIISSANSCESDAPVQPGRTPARLANLVTFLKTPQVEMVLDPEDQVDQLVEDEGGLGARLGAAGLGPGTPVARHPNYPRFRTGAQFNEGSPALANSQEKKGGGLRTMGRTLVAASGPDTPDTSDQAVEDILREVRNADAEEEPGDLVEAKKLKKRPTKRCLIASKDIDAAARERMGLGEAKRKKDEEEGGKEKKKKEPAPKKKKFSTPKGQQKMTSFFMR